MVRDELLKVAKPVIIPGGSEMIRAILDERKTAIRKLIKPQQFIGLLPDKCKNGTPEEFLREKKYMFKPYCDMTDAELIKASYKSPYQPGDILYVRETFVQAAAHIFWYKADDKSWIDNKNMRWKPSIHMPKEASRIFLRVTNVRVERLQEITEEQAKAEGICRLFDNMSKEEYEEWARKVGKMETQEKCLFKNYLWHGNFGKYGTGNRLSDAWKYQYSGYANAVESFSSLWNSTIDLKDWDRYGWGANPWVFAYEFELIPM